MGTFTTTIQAPITAAKLDTAMNDIMTEVQANTNFLSTNVTKRYRFGTTLNTDYSNNPGWSLVGTHDDLCLVRDHNKIYAMDTSNQSIYVATVDPTTYVTGTALSFTDTGLDGFADHATMVTTGDHLLYKKNTVKHDPITEIRVHPLDANGDLATPVVDTVLGNSYDHFASAAGYIFGMGINGTVYRIDLDAAGNVTGEIAVSSPSLIENGYGWIVGNSTHLFYAFGGVPTDTRMASVAVSGVDGSLGTWVMNPARYYENRIFNPGNKGSHGYSNPFVANDLYIANMYSLIRGDSDSSSLWDDNLYQVCISPIRNGKATSWYRDNSSSAWPSSLIDAGFVAFDKAVAGTPSNEYDWKVEYTTDHTCYYIDVGGGDKMNFFWEANANNDLSFYTADINGSLDTSGNLIRTWSFGSFTNSPSINTNIDMTFMVSYGADHLVISARQGSVNWFPIMLAPFDVYKSGVTPVNTAESWGYNRWGLSGQNKSFDSENYGIIVYTPAGGEDDYFSLIGERRNNVYGQTSAPYRLSEDFGGSIDSFVYPFTRQTVMRRNSSNNNTTVYRGFFSKDNDIIFVYDSYGSLWDQVQIDGITYRVHFKQSDTTYGIYDILVREDEA